MGKRDSGTMGFWERGFQEKEIKEYGILGNGDWDNWVCIKSRAVGVKVDRRFQSQQAGLEQGERTKVLVFKKDKSV